MSLEIKSVNWCDRHRINFPCHKMCSQCLGDLRSLMEEYRRQPLLEALSVSLQEGYDTGCTDMIYLVEREME